MCQSDVVVELLLAMQKSSFFLVWVDFRSENLFLCVLAFMRLLFDVLPGRTVQTSRPEVDQRDEKRKKRVTVLAWVG